MGSVESTVPFRAEVAPFQDTAWMYIYTTQLIPVMPICRHAWKSQMLTPYVCLKTVTRGPSHQIILSSTTTSSSLLFFIVLPFPPLHTKYSHPPPHSSSSSWASAPTPPSGSKYDHDVSATFVVDPPSHPPTDATCSSKSVG